MIRKRHKPSKYSPYMTGHNEQDNFLKILISVTTAICVVLISLSAFFLGTMPKEAYANISWLSAGDKEIKKVIFLPEPTEDIRIKANRLREIRYEEYLEHCYTPLEGEMDNVYVYDNKKKCYLTFDDGPSSVTPIILDVLKQYKAKATFFVTGNNCKKNSKIIKNIISDGHAVGNHSFSHDYKKIYSSGNAFRNEVKECMEAINEALGESYDNLVFRFPGGYDSLTDEESKKTYRNILTELGYKYIDWSCLTGDSNTTEPTEKYLMDTLNMTIGHSVTGDIVVLMHDSPTKEITAKTLPKIIEYLYEEGYEFDTLNRGM